MYVVTSNHYKFQKAIVPYSVLYFDFHPRELGAAGYPIKSSINYRRRIMCHALPGGGHKTPYYCMICKNMRILRRPDLLNLGLQCGYG